MAPTSCSSKPGIRPSGAELDLHVLALAALERRTVDCAFEVHDDEVTDRSGVLLGRVFPALALAGELLELLVDCLFVGLDGQAIEFDIVDVGLGDVGKRLQADLHFGILAVFVALSELDLRLERGADLLVAQQLLDAVLHRTLQRFTAQAVAVHLADKIRRHLARPEARHPDLRRKALHFLFDPRFDVLGGDGQHEGALEALFLSLDSLGAHGLIPKKLSV